MGSLFLLQRMFQTQELNQGLLHSRWILYQLRYQGSPQKCHHKGKSTLDYIKIKNFVYQKTPLGECKGKLQSGRKHMQCINS